MMTTPSPTNNQRGNPEIKSKDKSLLHSTIPPIGASTCIVERNDSNTQLMFEENYAPCTLIKRTCKFFRSSRWWSVARPFPLNALNRGNLNFNLKAYQVPPFYLLTYILHIMKFYCSLD
jgi:hypothetical protein